ncbi:Siroheme synthase [Neomoorella glycerini]|uniref:uroporphyrinogen-III C-methyltransferase n=1 Tax=Neomoorella glycerini TaxID=55779 RepID=A0A6I5ZV94_9FIRM|nr:uroporphyrinogen-III C-methyltransferase [Moorella glycerini]QGP93615.1 Siroheme synthase [Moorella glycerini]
MAISTGKVYLVGAGPGDAGLLTIKGQECLARADVVVYDRLINPSLLDYAPQGAAKIYVGKAPYRHALRQEEINELLVELARQGKQVVRLKGGDPFVFGRGGEEALALKAAGIPFEVVPGVTAAIAVPAYAGIPVTHRGLASTVAFITGNEDPGKESSAINWEALAGAVDTLVFLMGMANLAPIVSRLLACGRTPATPVALIRWGTRAEQETLVGTLADIEAKAQEAGFSNPAIIVVGQVVSLRSALAWLEGKPLFGRRVVITRPRAQAEAMARRLADLGAEVLAFPAIEIQPPADWGHLDAALAKIKDFEWLIFTSANGVRYLCRRLQERQLDIRTLAGIKIAAIGPATARALQERGLNPDWQPGEYVAEAVAAGLGPLLQGRRVLLPRADIARPFLAEDLRRQGAEVTEVAVYRTVKRESEVSALRELLAAGKVTAVTFTSSSTVKSFLDLLGDETLTLMQGVDVFCLGPITAATAREAGLAVTATAGEYTEAGLIRAMLDYYAGRKAGEEN